jgi:hypothetical protein
MRDFLVIGLVIAATLILARVIWKSPFIWTLRESFANAASTSGHLLNSATECPTGSRMYMYNGKAYCCSGLVNVDADTVQQSCRAWTPTPGSGSPSDMTFCSLGPTADGVVNCLETLSGRMQADGERYCPPSMPNYVKGPTLPLVRGRCCKSPADSRYQECADQTQPHCDVTTEEDFFKLPNSCQFQKAGANVQCPSNYNMIAVLGQNNFQGATLIGCSDSGTICYTADIMSKLKKLGYDTSSLSACPASSGGASAQPSVPTSA